MNESTTTMVDLAPTTQHFLDDVLTGLRSSPKRLPCKYFYDQTGSQLFDAICELDEYYLTRTELAIMERHASEMADQIGPDAMLVEYGSGSSLKTRLLMDRLLNPAGYVPVDISREHLHETASRLATAYPHIEILPVCADFTKPFALPKPRRTPDHAAIYFPGSTIGNFTPTAAEKILAQIARQCSVGGGLLIGIDLQKDRRTLEAAYNDSAGVTARFNLNLLHRMQRELEARLDVEQFQHQAVYHERRGRIEMSLISLRTQTIGVGDEEFQLSAGEEICTEYSHKYTVEGFANLAARSGFSLHRHWTDAQRRFGVLHLVVEAPR